MIVATMVRWRHYMRTGENCTTRVSGHRTRRRTAIGPESQRSEEIAERAKLRAIFPQRSAFVDRRVPGTDRDCARAVAFAP